VCAIVIPENRARPAPSVLFFFPSPKWTVAKLDQRRGQRPRCLDSDMKRNDACQEFQYVSTPPEDMQEEMQGAL
jgi:hypothetical protein